MRSYVPAMDQVTDILQKLRDSAVSAEPDAIALLLLAHAHDHPAVRSQLAVKLSHAEPGVRWELAFACWAHGEDTLRALALGFPVGGVTFGGLELAGVPTQHGDGLAHAVVATLEPGSARVVVGWWPTVQGDKVRVGGESFEVPDDPVTFAALLPPPAAGALAEVLEPQVGAGTELRGPARLLEGVVEAMPSCLALGPHGT